MMWLYLIFHVVLILYGNLGITAYTCTTPNGEKGNCVSVADCPILLKSFTKPLNGAEDFLNQYYCGPGGQVCCLDRWRFLFSGMELSDRRYCGVAQADDYTQNRRIPAITEFPWLAAIIGTFPETGGEDVVCHGALINQRYILTAAQCFTGYNSKKHEITKVLLGDYNTKNKTDCVAFIEGYPECTVAVEYNIERKILHPNYIRIGGLNDIALLRLEKEVEFTDYVRPICLPISSSVSPKYGEILYISGWGKSTLNGEPAVVKKKIRTSLIKESECQENFTNIRIMPTYHMCTLDEKENEEFSCDGDAGAPVMFSYRYQWFLRGIVSTGNICSGNTPGVHTSVAGYLEWIFQNIRP